MSNATPPIELHIDPARFEQLVPMSRRMRTCGIIEQTVRENRERMNVEFFGRMQNYQHRPIIPAELSMPDLFSPNLCVIDFADRYLDRDLDVILDYGCGLGICDVYLKELGFGVLGFDRWKQVPQDVAVEFQDKMGTRVVFTSDLSFWKQTVLMHVSIWIFPEDIASAVGPTVQWVLSDSRYVTTWSDTGGVPPGFYLWGEYPSFLTIFRRIGE